ncbi:MAG: alpha-mannosidase [Lentisphaerae bacterium RIFOXYA12_FULL_48_11]|nr:MAG: alpha-mannosidase [Lentisphaerae bacterium RIFOXYA12_FULL_48_11]
MRKVLFLLVLISVVSSCVCPCKNRQVDYTRYVNPFIGCAENGHTFPGACYPFGMIQASPDSGNCTWAYCSGYMYLDEKIWGFSQTHLNGTGCPDLGDVQLQPFTGSIERENYHSRFSKESQQAKPGYYAVTLSDFGVDVELTASPRVAFHRYTYKKPAPARLLVDLQYGIVSGKDQLKRHILESNVTAEDKYTITGHNQAQAWVKRHYYYVIKFDKPYTVMKQLPAQDGEKAPRYILDFDLKPGEQLQVKVALSTVSVDGAKRNLSVEIPGWDFVAVRQAAKNAWNGLLSRADVEGTKDQKENFYTSMYHLFIQPNNIADVDGQYRGADDKVMTAPDNAYYSTLSLWDTYRAAHPLYTILTPERVDGFVNTMIAHQKAQGYVPIWTLWGKENHCMIANHSVPVIVDAYLKGFRGFDAEAAFQAIKTSLTVNHQKSDWDVYMKYGYLPFDIIKGESVSRTLEYVYDDYCAAQFAKALGKKEDAEYFGKRAGHYKNMFCPETKFMRGRDSKGEWRNPFDPFKLNHGANSGFDYTEGNAWQYTWHVQHDPDGLIALVGGKDAFAEKLSKLFKLESKVEGSGFVLDVSGLIGQYAHGNEPSHHVAYFFNHAGKPWKTQEMIREIFDTQYKNYPGGLCGNDDCGQMSAWYIFSAMGFYPFNPCGDGYVFGAPQIGKISLKLPKGKTFTVEAKNLSKANKYVQSITLNGKKYDSIKIAHQDVMNGGSLVFEMGPQPLK